MRVKVTLDNILDYGLDAITGNSRADLLARAAEEEALGFEMYVNIPDVVGGDTEIPEERNVFEHFGSDGLPEPDGAVHQQEAVNLSERAYIEKPCHYRVVTLIDNDSKWVCNVHNEPSKHSIVHGSHEPCLKVDPYDD